MIDNYRKQIRIFEICDLLYIHIYIYILYIIFLSIIRKINIKRKKNY